MKRLTAVRAHNYTTLRAVSFSLDPAANVILFAGPNGAGKSSLIDAINYALTDEIPRGLRYKKDAKELITQGEKDGWLGVAVYDGEREEEYRISLKTGTASGTGAPPLGHAAFTLNPASFLALEPAQRRKVLFARAGIQASVPDVTRRLLAQGHDEAQVKELVAFLSGGFDSAAKRATERVSESRGAWQQVTGEAYGAQKAEGWKAEAPVAWDDPAEIDKKVQAKRQQLTQLASARDQLKSADQMHQNAAALRESAATVGKHEAAIRGLEQDIESAKVKIAEFDQQASGGGRGWTCACPSCGEMLVSESAGRLEKYVAPSKNAAMAKAGAEAERAALRDLEQALSRAQQALVQARGAQSALEQLPERPTPGEITAATAEATVAAQELTLLEGDLERAVNAQREAASAEQRTMAAAAHHKALGGYSKLADALTAMPGEFLTEATESINAELRRISTETGLRRTVTLGQDMALRYGDVTYPLLSASEQWRARMALGLALGERDGGILLLDRFDEIEPADRPPILLALAKQTAVQVVIGATLKAEPPKIPGVQTFWMGRA